MPDRAKLLFIVIAAGALAGAVAGCKGTTAPEGLWESRPTGGPRVAFDLYASPLPEVPLPIDVATRPDRTSATGRRINASQIAPTGVESDIRALLDGLDGWGTYAAITFSLEPVDHLIDIGNVLRRHTGDNFDFTDDAIYLIDIEPSSPDYGRPIAVDLGEGNYPVNLEQRHRYYGNDPRTETTALMFETTYEDTNGNGRLDVCEDRDHDGEADPGEDLDGDGEVFSAERDENGNGVLDPEEDLNGNGRLDCGEDTDFDGHLDIPNLYCGDDSRGERIPPWECPDVTVDTPNGEVVIEAEDAWLLSWYELETNTVIARPMVPLRERSRYAVVLTNRLVDEQGRAVESPFPWIHHSDQADSIADLATVLAENSEVYGGLSIDDVQMAWTFTTQTVTRDIQDIREGLYGRGPLSDLADEYPPEATADVAYGCVGGGTGCDLPDNVYSLPAHGEDGLVGVLSEFADEAFGLDEEEFLPLEDTYDYVDHFVSLRVRGPNFLDANGESEDLDGDGRLDLADEDLDGDGELGPEEDIDLDGHLDVNEDVNGNLILDGEERVWDVETSRGHYPHASHNITALLSVPRADPARGIEPPYPVVVYVHGYTSMRIESMGFAGSMAKFGIATLGMDAVHHGLGVDEILEETIRAAVDERGLGPLGDALLTDRALDLDGDGAAESGGDFWTAYMFMTRDMVRQSGIDAMRLIQVLRSFDGERLSNQDFDGDGELDLAGDFDADGQFDVGGVDNAYFAMGSSLGGIMASFLAGLEPAVVAAAPIAGGGGLGDVAIRSVQGGVKEAVILRLMGPLVITNPAAGYIDLISCTEEGDCPGGACVDGVCRCDSDRDCVGGGESGFRCADAGPDMESQERVCTNPRDTACGLGQISARYTVPDVNDDTDVEFACLDPDDLGEGDTIVVTNGSNGESSCFVAWPEGRSRVSLPSDLHDQVELVIYEGDVLLDGDTCELRQDAEEIRRVETFEVPAEFQIWSWEEGEALVTPAEGFGAGRARPSTRRLMGIAQIILDPGDPANMATHYFLDPLDYGEESAPANVMVVATVGDMNVPVNTGIAIARAAGALDYTRIDPRLVDEAHPEGVTPNRFLLDHDVILGLEHMSVYRRDSDGEQVLFDADDMDRSGSPPEELVDWTGDGMGAPSHPTPFRFWRRQSDTDTCTCVDGSGEHECSWPGDTVGPIESVRCPEGVTLLTLPYLRTTGQHSLNIPDPTDQFDINTFMINMIGTFFASGGTEVHWGLCMEDNSCTVEEDGFYVPPVPAEE